MNKKLFFYSISIFFLTLGQLTFSQHHPTNQPQKTHNNHHEHLIQAFEDPTRESWQKPQEIIRLMGNLKEKTIIDIGCGTGYFAERLAKAGANVICADIDTIFLNYARKKRDSLGLHYELRLIPPDHPGMKPNEVDLVLLVNTYHHLNNRVQYMKEVYSLLKPNGSIWIVDFYKKELPVGPPPDHKISHRKVLKELREAGFKHISLDRKTLPYQYIIRVDKR